MNFKKLFLVFALLGVMVVPIIGFTADSCTISQDRLEQFTEQGLKCSTTCTFTTNSSSGNFDCGTCCLLNSIYNIVDWAFLIIMAFSVIAIIWAAVMFLTSGGESEKVSSAKQIIMYAAVGIIVALLAKAVPSIVTSMVL